MNTNILDMSIMLWENSDSRLMTEVTWRLINEHGVLSEGSVSDDFSEFNWEQVVEMLSAEEEDDEEKLSDDEQEDDEEEEYVVEQEVLARMSLL